MIKPIVNRVGLTVMFCCLQMFLHAQSNADSVAPTLDDTMRSHDKIYVVMAVCLLILLVLFLYLIRIDIKISRKEKGI